MNDTAGTGTVVGDVSARSRKSYSTLLGVWAVYMLGFPHSCGGLTPLVGVPPPPNQPLPVFPTFGPKEGCSLTGSRVYKSGAYCYPFQRFTISSILNSPAFKGCCRPCPEQFGLELDFLEITEEMKVQAMDRFHSWAMKHHGAPHPATMGKPEKSRVSAEASQKTVHIVRDSSLIQSWESGQASSELRTSREKKSGASASLGNVGSGSKVKSGSTPAAGGKKSGSTPAAGEKKSGSALAAEGKKSGSTPAAGGKKSGSNAAKSGSGGKSGSNAAKSGSGGKNGAKSGSGGKSGTTSGASGKNGAKSGASGTSGKSGKSESVAKSGSLAKASMPPPPPPGGGGREPDGIRPSVPPPPSHDYSQDASVMGGSTFGFGLMGQAPQGGGVTGMSTGGFVSGPQVERLLPCCKVCPEQFLMPTSLSDVTTSFLQKSEHQNVQAEIKTQGSKSESSNENSFKNSQLSKKAGPASSMAASAFSSSAASSSKAGDAAKGGGGLTDMDTGYRQSTCCKMCDRHTMAAQSTFGFIELMESGMNRKKHRTLNSRNNLLSKGTRMKGFAGGFAAMAGNAAMRAAGGNMFGNTGSCCPMCPSLQTMLNGNVPQDEAFGGPFGKALESEIVGAPLTKLEEDMLRQLADEANMDASAAARDPGMAAAARARAAASLAGKPISDRRKRNI